MSEPTYRIVTDHDPQYTFEPWTAKVFALAEPDASISQFGGATEADALALAQAAISRMDNRQVGHEWFATEAGEIVPAPEPSQVTTGSLNMVTGEVKMGGPA
jgi:hypothetical protein